MIWSRLLHIHKPAGRLSHLSRVGAAFSQLVTRGHRDYGTRALEGKAQQLSGSRFLSQIRDRRLSCMSLVTGHFVARHDPVSPDKKHIGFAGSTTGHKNARVRVVRHFKHLPTPVAIPSKRDSEPQRLISPYRQTSACRLKRADRETLLLVGYPRSIFRK